MHPKKFWASIVRHHGALAGALGLAGGCLLTFDRTRALGVVVSLIAICLTVVAIVDDLRRSRRAKKAVLGVVSALHRAADVDGILVNLANQLQLPSPWRITIYEVVEGNWVRLARSSSFPSYAQSVGRPRFPIDQGCVSWALKFGGKDELPNLPDPQADYQEYCRIQASRNVLREHVDVWSMRPRSYAALSFRIPFGAHEGVHLGVVVETDAPNGAVLSRVQRLVSLEVAMLLHRIIKVEPAVRDAQAALGNLINEALAESSS